MSSGVAVLGSGPAGVACAHALLAAGATVTLFDGGAHADAELVDRYAQLSEQEPEAWDAELVDALRHEFAPSLADIPLKPVLGSLHAYAQDHPARPNPASGVLAMPSTARGGLSTVWGAAVAPYSDRDLGEWPIGERELADHYRAVLKFMPLAGEHDALERIMPLYTDTPGTLPTTPQARSLVDDLRASTARLGRRGIIAGRSRLALQTTDNHGPGGRCRNAGVCLHGCPYGAIYRTDLEALRLAKNPQLTYRPGDMVERIDEADNDVTLHLREPGGGIRRERFERTFVATGPLVSTRLALMSLDAYDRDIEMQDSPYFSAPMLRLPGAPVSTAQSGVTLAQAFVEIDNPAVSANMVHIQVYGYSDLVLREVAGRLHLSPAALERHGQPLLGRLLLAQACMHSNSSDPVHVRLQRDGTLGFALPPNDDRPRTQARAAAHLLLQAAKDLRTLLLAPMLKVWEPGRSNHLGGSFPMANQPRGVQSDLLGRPGGLERVHLVDASVLPTIPGPTVTFSVMANAHRIGHEAMAG